MMIAFPWPWLITCTMYVHIVFRIEPVPSQQYCHPMYHLSDFTRRAKIYALWLFNPIKLHAARIKQQHSVTSMCIRSDIYVRCWPEDKGVARFTTSTLRLLPKIFVFVVPLLDQNFLFWRCYLDPWPVIDFDIAIFQDLLNLLESCK